VVLEAVGFVSPLVDHALELFLLEPAVVVVVYGLSVLVGLAYPVFLL